MSSFDWSDLRKDRKNERENRGENKILYCLVGRENRRSFGGAKAFSPKVH